MIQISNVFDIGLLESRLQLDSLNLVPQNSIPIDESRFQYDVIAVLLGYCDEYLRNPYEEAVLLTRISCIAENP